MAKSFSLFKEKAFHINVNDNYFHTAPFFVATIFLLYFIYYLILYSYFIILQPLFSMKLNSVKIKNFSRFLILISFYTYHYSSSSNHIKQGFISIFNFFIYFSFYGGIFENSWLTPKNSLIASVIGQNHLYNLSGINPFLHFL